MKQESRGCLRSLAASCISRLARRECEVLGGGASVFCLISTPPAMARERPALAQHDTHFCSIKPTLDPPHRYMQKCEGRKKEPWWSKEKVPHRLSSSPPLIITQYPCCEQSPATPSQPHAAFFCRGSDLKKTHGRTSTCSLGRVGDIQWIVKRAASNLLRQQSPTSIWAGGYVPGASPAHYPLVPATYNLLPSTASFRNKLCTLCLPPPHIFGSHAMTSGVLHDSQSIAHELRFSHARPRCGCLFVYSNSHTTPLCHETPLSLPCRYSQDRGGGGVCKGPLSSLFFSSHQQTHKSS